MEEKITGQEITMSDEETMSIKMPEHPDRITFESNEIMIGSDKLCMLGEWGMDFEKINTLEFIMGEKRDKKYIFKKVQV